MISSNAVVSFSSDANVPNVQFSTVIFKKRSKIIAVKKYYVIFKNRNI